jgi:hypothetical protein
MPQVEDVAQLFLGVRMQCAQCHHHPFERWTPGEYYHLAAFFSQIGRKPTAIAGEDLIFHKRGTAQTEHRKTRVMLKPAGLGEPPSTSRPTTIRASRSPTGWARRQSLLREGAREPLLEALLQTRPRRARG